MFTYYLIYRSMAPVVSWSAPIVFNGLSGWRFPQGICLMVSVDVKHHVYLLK